ITKDSRPTFVGQGDPLAVVQVTARKSSTWPTQVVNLGTAVVDSFGNWSLYAPFVPDGAYTVVASQTPANGFPTQPVTLSSPLVVDTLGPRVAHLQFVPKRGLIIAVLSDVGSGVNPATAKNPAN